MSLATPYRSYLDQRVAIPARVVRSQYGAAVRRIPPEVCGSSTRGRARLRPPRLHPAFGAAAKGGDCRFSPVPRNWHDRHRVRLSVGVAHALGEPDRVDCVVADVVPVTPSDPARERMADLDQFSFGE